MTDITLPRAVVQAALDALQSICSAEFQREAAEALEAALAQAQAEPADKQRLDWYEANTDKLVLIGPTWYRRAGYQQPYLKVGRVFRQAIDAAMRDAGIDLVEAQPATQPHLFEFWWEKHMPNATQAEAWAAWTDAPSSKGVDVAQPAPAGEPVAIVEVAVPHLRSIIVNHIQGAPFPKVGDFFYTTPQPTAPAGEPVAIVTHLEKDEPQIEVTDAGRLRLGKGDRLFTTQQPRKQLTDDDLEDIAVAARSGNLFDLRRAIEAAITGGQA